MATSEGNGSVSDRATEAAHDAVDRLGESSARAEEMLRDQGEYAMERSGELMEDLEAYVHEHPLTAVGIAVAAGFVLGSLMRS